mmetsp:Transcript_36898/g.106394  ORF Transcript_36898/g.106394 Transcript_36898/m.106394 type:complete len:230 (+) Transcript_36898:618-1307(+)
MDNRRATSGEGPPPKRASCRLSNSCSTSCVCLSKACSWAVRKVHRCWTWACRGLKSSSAACSRGSCWSLAAMSSSRTLRSRWSSACWTRTCACTSSTLLCRGSASLGFPTVGAGAIALRPAGAVALRRSEQTSANSLTRLGDAPHNACARPRHLQAVTSTRMSCVCDSALESLLACRCTSVLIHLAWPSAVSAASSSRLQRPRQCQSRRWVSISSRSASSVLALSLANS